MNNTNCSHWNGRSNIDGTNDESLTGQCIYCHVMLDRVYIENRLNYIEDKLNAIMKAGNLGMLPGQTRPTDGIIKNLTEVDELPPTTGTNSEKVNTS